MKTTAAMNPLRLLLVVAAATTVQAICSIQRNHTLEFFGLPDTDRQEVWTATADWSCGDGNLIASAGNGSWDNPVSFSTDSWEFARCAMIYVPYLKKYARYEIRCYECEKDYATKWRHIKLWIGDEQVRGEDQHECEDFLTKGGRRPRAVIRNPDNWYEVDPTPLYERGLNKSSCNSLHTYPDDRRMAHKSCLNALAQ